MKEEDFYSFGPFRMNVKKGILLRDMRRVPLRRGLVDLLLVLIENAYEPLSYDFLIEKVWRGKPDTNNESVSQAVAELRKGLGDDRHEYIDTIQGVGYMFTPHASADGGDETVIRRPDKVIAVLPFKNLGGAQQKILELAIPDALVTSLGSLKNVTVRPTSTVQRLYASGADPLSIARAVSADTVIDGSIQAEGERLRVAVRFFGSDGSSLGGVTHDEVYTDMFSTQDSVSRQVSRQLGLEPTEGEEKLFMKRHTQNVYAYECYLMGREHWNRRTVEEFRLSIGFFKKALVEDPGYALPYVGIADAYTLLGTVAFSEIPPREVMPEAKEAVRAALALDDSLPEAHTSDAFIKLIFDWDWEGAHDSFGRALKLNPGYAPAHHWRAHLLLAKGRHEEAVEAMRTAMTLDPTSPMIHGSYGWMLHLTRRHDQAIKHLRKTVALHPHFAPGHGMLGFAYEAKGLLDEALAEFDVCSKTDTGPTRLAAVGHAHAVSGDRRRAKATLNKLRKMAEARYVSPYFFALVHAGLGETDEALAELFKAYDDRCDWLMHLAVEPRWDNLRESAEFKRLLRLVGLG